ncbi:thioesterase domain-containing protein [Actinophytocola sp.]|uniref:thioesterase domain-containing protein n=1 Tax=Actinophytocola sp. TaxID=1872138 RepID=UPI00389A7B5F
MSQVVDISTDSGYARPRDPVELWLARCWQEVLGFGVGIRENFFGIGGNSLDAARVVNAVLDELHVQLPLNVVTENPTVARLAARLRDQDTSALATPLQEIQSGDGTRPPLFMVHPDDGQAGSYCHLARAMGEEFAVFGLQAVGLYSDAEPIRTVAAMARAYVEEIRTVDPEGPYLLGGCSTGAAIAFEMAGQLVGAGAEVRLLAAVDAELVEPRAGGQRPRDRDDVPGLLFDMLVADDVTESWFRELPRPRQLAAVLADWQAHDLVAPDETTQFVARSLRVRQANREAIHAWRPRPYPGPLDIFRDAADARPPTVSWPASVVQRVHECAAATDATHTRQLARGLQDLFG